MKSGANELNRADFRKFSNYYVAVASELAGPALRVISRLSCGRPTPRESWRKGLIISHTHIGDVLYRTASLPHLRAALPNCEWHYLTSQESAPVLLANPAISQVHPFVRGENSWTLAPGGFGRLRRERYDVVLCSNSVRHYPDFALAVALRIPNRVGYAHRGFSAVITHPIAIEHPKPYPAYFREMVSQLCGIEPVWPLRPHIEVSPGDRVAADEFLYGFGNDHSALIACCPFTRQARGQWPEKFFVDTVNALAKEIAIRVLVCGSAAELGRLNAFARELGAPCKVQAGELNLPAFAALLSRCSVVFSQDSGPRHIGNAAGAPVVFVRNLWFLPEEAGAYCASETDAAPAVPFASESDYAAVQASLLPATVAEKLLRILSG